MVGLLLGGCDLMSGQATPAPVAQGYIAFLGPGYSIQVPTEWRQVSNEQFQALFLAPAADGFSPNLGVSLEPTLADTTIVDIAASAKRSQSEAYDKYQVISEQEMTVSDQPAYKRVYQWHDPDSDLDVTQVQLFVKQKDTLYMLTGTSLTQSYPAYGPVFEYMLSTFVLR
jgi:hypothetical protein